MWLRGNHRSGEVLFGALAALVCSAYLLVGTGGAVAADGLRPRPGTAVVQEAVVTEVLDRGRTGESLEVGVRWSAGRTADVDLADSRCFGAEDGVRVMVAFSPGRPSIVVAADTVGKPSGALVPLVVGCVLVVGATGVVVVQGHMLGRRSRRRRLLG